MECGGFEILPWSNSDLTIFCVKWVDFGGASIKVPLYVWVYVSYT